MLSPFPLLAPTPGASPITGLIPVIAMVLIFYFLLIAPVRRRQKQHDAMVANLKNGDRVITNNLASVVQGARLRLEEDSQ